MLVSRKNRASTQSSSRPTFEMLEERQHFSVYTVTNTLDTGAGSLRAAISAVDAGKDNTIDFNIPKTVSGYSASAKLWTIDLQSELPAVQRAITIDGLSQPGSKGKPVIEIDGRDMPAAGYGFDVVGGNSIVRGFSMDNFSTAVELNGTVGKDQVTTNSFGLGNGRYGLTTAIQVNVASCTVTSNSIANAQIGIHLHTTNYSTVSNNTVSQCETGIYLDNYSFGGTVTGNYVKGCNSAGIDVYSSTANTIGTIGHGNTVIATSAAANGIYLSGLSNTINGNTIAGAYDGITVEDGLNGSKNNKIQGNNIANPTEGTAITIDDGVNGDLIGGYTSGLGNTITGTGFAGVFVSDGDGLDAVVGNSISVGASGLGIDMEDGSDDAQNAPIITSAKEVNGKLVITGDVLNTYPGNPLRVELFASSAANEGQVFLGYLTVTANQATKAGFSVFSDTLAINETGKVITSTSTAGATGNTSEFSNAVKVQ